MHSINKLFLGTVSLLLILSATTLASVLDFQASDTAKNQKLRWKNNLIPISISGSLLKESPSIRPDSDVSGAISRSLETWSRVANVRFVEMLTTKNSVSPSARQGDGISLLTVAQTVDNLLLFSGESTDVSARTRVFYDSKGFISEADIVLNPYQQFSTDGSFGTFDLEATLTHEIGHLLGLEHSIVFGAAMHSNLGINGVYGLSSIASRNLSEDDIVRIRAIYGGNGPVENCCGNVAGYLTNDEGKSIVDAEVWFEDQRDGRVVSGVVTGGNGAFRADGLPSGDYRAYAKINRLNGTVMTSAVEKLGMVEVVNGRTVKLSRQLKSEPIDFELQYVGFNGQISQLAVPVNGGRSYIVYIGGKNLDVNQQSILFSSQLIRINPKSVIRHQFGEDLSVLSFEITLEANIEKGDYSITVSNSRGDTDVLIGCLSVSEFENSSYSYISSLRD